MRTDQLFDCFDTLLAAPDDVAHLEAAILDLAVQGKLVPQDPKDEPAGILVERIEAEKDRVRKEKGIRKTKPLPPIQEDEIPYLLPDGWEWVRLDTICYQITDGTHYTPTYVDNGVPFLSVKDISGGFIDFSNTRFITREEHEGLIRRCRPEFGDMLLTKVGTTGIAKIVDTYREFSIFVSVALLKFNTEEIYPQYLEYVINSPFVKQQSEEYTMGVGNKNLVLKHIKNFFIPIPPLAEQKRIVAKVDALLAQTRALAAQLEQADAALVPAAQAAFQSLLDAQDTTAQRAAWQRITDHFDTLTSDPRTIEALKQTVLQLAVHGKLVPQDPDDEPASVLLERIKVEKAQLIQEGRIRKAKPLPPIRVEEAPYELPEKWEWVRFGAITNIATNLTDPSLFPDLPHVAPNNIEKGSGKLLEYNTVQEDGIRSSNHYFYPGQLLYSKIRPNLSKVAIVDFEGLCSADMYPIDSFAEPRYLLTYILSRAFLNLVVGKDTRVAMPKINQTALNKILVALPPLAEQKRIVAKVEALMTLCDSLSAQVAQAQEVRARLLQAVLNGE